MNLADKLCYPSKGKGIIPADGLTFRERLIIALASNSGIICYPENDEMFFQNAKNVLWQADIIIKQLEDK